MKLVRTLLASFVFLILTGIAAADTYEYPARRPVFSITFPEDWEVELEDELLHAGPSDQSLYLGLWAVEDIDSLDEAGDAIGEIILDLVPDAELDDPEDIEVNDIEFTVLEGSGTSDDFGFVNVTVAFFTPDNRQVFVLLYFAPPRAEKRYESDLEGILYSVRRR